MRPSSSSSTSIYYTVLHGTQVSLALPPSVLLTSSSILSYYFMTFLPVGDTLDGTRPQPQPPRPPAADVKTVVIAVLLLACKAHEIHTILPPSLQVFSPPMKITSTTTTVGRPQPSPHPPLSSTDDSMKIFQSIIHAVDRIHWRLMNSPFGDSNNAKSTFLVEYDHDGNDDEVENVGCTVPSKPRKRRWCSDGIVTTSPPSSSPPETPPLPSLPYSQLYTSQRHHSMELENVILHSCGYSLLGFQSLCIVWNWVNRILEVLIEKDKTVGKGKGGHPRHRDDGKIYTNPVRVTQKESLRLLSLLSQSGDKLNDIFRWRMTVPSFSLPSSNDGDYGWNDDDCENTRILILSIATVTFAMEKRGVSLITPTSSQLTSSSSPGNNDDEATTTSNNHDEDNNTLPQWAEIFLPPHTTNTTAAMNNTTTMLFKFTRILREIQ